MPPRSNPNVVKKFVVVGGVLAALQIAAIYLLSDGTPPTNKDAIEQAVSKLNDVTPERKQMVRIQIALADYTAKNKGRPPSSLAELVPSYFDAIPPDPATGKPFKYRVEAGKYFLGDAGSGQPATVKASSSKGTTSAQGTSGVASDAEKDALLAALTDDPNSKTPAYDPSGKRDPFKPFDLAPKAGSGNKTPLEGYPIDKLTYSAYLQSESDPKAIIEADEGRGFTVSKGMKVGPNSGEITDILPDKIIIVETEVDFTGEKRTRTVELYIGVRNDKTGGRLQRKTTP